MLLYGESTGNGKKRSWRSPVSSGWGETTAPASSGTSCLIVLASSASADWSPSVVYSLKQRAVRVCAMLCDSRRILKIGKVVRKKENGDEREQKKFLHCERRNAYHILRIEGRMVEENDADDVSV